MSLRPAFAIGAVFFGVSVTARADLPPPDGQKFVSYAFRVENVKAFSDWVLLAYPCSGSSGVPMMEAQLVTDSQPLGVGRRGGMPELYRMKKTDYEASKTVIDHKAPSTDGKELEALFQSPKVAKCTGAKPSPQHVLAKTDPRDAITQ